MRFSILHLSDLHRDLRDEVSNGPLLDSLLRDISHFAERDPTILEPSICIVSGDLVYGVRPTDAEAPSELRRQYRQTVEFLATLADALFEGNRDRIVLLPGNHDVSYPATIESSTRIELHGLSTDERNLLVAELFGPRSLLRWSWSDLCFFRITDSGLYERRLEEFQRAYSEFYSNGREFSLQPEKQFAVFDYPDLNLSVAALNSCYRNDPMHRAGGFHPDALNAACRELGKPIRAGRLLAAAWHHSISGGPSQDDFLDHEFVQLLIDTGVSLGFHGHQHFHECVDERYRLGPTRRKMTIISASTLCASSTNLRPGVPRGFNVVEIDTNSWVGTTHSRHMVSGSPTLPLWGPGYFNATGKSYVDFEICQPLMRRPSHLDVSQVLEKADEMLRTGQSADAVALLKDMRDVPMAQPLLMSALGEIADDDLTIRTLWPPSTNAEIVLVGSAIISQQNQQRAQEFLSLDSVSRNSDASVQETRKRVALRWSR